MPRKRLKKPVTVRPCARTVTGFDPSGSRRATVGSGLKGHCMICPPRAETKHARQEYRPASVSSFACERRTMRPAGRASAARSAGTARRRQGWMPEGTRLAARGSTRSATARPAAQRRETPIDKSSALLVFPINPDGARPQFAFWMRRSHTFSSRRQSVVHYGDGQSCGKGFA